MAGTKSIRKAATNVQTPGEKGPRHGASSEEGYPDWNSQEHRATGRDQIAVTRLHSGETMEYIAYLHKDRKSDFGVSFPDFPGCVTAGKTLDEARRMASEALALHIRGMAEDGETVPDPSTIDDVSKDPALKGAVAFLVSVDLEKTVRVNITARESQIELIDRLARQAGMTRSAYMVQGVGRARVAENSRGAADGKITKPTPPIMQSSCFIHFPIDLPLFSSYDVGVRSKILRGRPPFQQPGTSPP
jgi:predicted RNase H-like HicB family nuclease